MSVGLLATEFGPKWVMLCEAVDKGVCRTKSGRYRRGWNFHRAMEYAEDLIRRCGSDESAQDEIRDLVTRRWGAEIMSTRRKVKA